MKSTTIESANKATHLWALGYDNAIAHLGHDIVIAINSIKTNSITIKIRCLLYKFM